MAVEAPPPMTKAMVSFYDKISKQHLTALWSVFSELITPEPTSVVKSHLWRYDDIREHLMEAGDLITAKEAERRVLILENPGLPGQSRVSNSLYAGVQLVKAGEIAPSHRHSQSALRFVLEGGGAYTAVDGERVYMQPGDFVITAPWRWHEHRNDTDEPIIWLDGLDIPIVQLFDCSFAEGWDDDEYPTSRPAGDTQARFGSGLLPVDYDRKPKHSPLLSYPYERTRSALADLSKNAAWDPCHGLKLKFVNPTDGGYAMATIGTFMQLLPKGFKTNRYRSTDATVFTVVEGCGRTTIGETSFTWGPRDIFVAPSWRWITHQASEDAVLFSYSDRPIQESAGLFREQRESA